MVAMTRRLLLVVVAAVLLVAAAGGVLIYRGTQPCHGATHCIVDK
jgi:hypothetical protein